MYKLELVEFMSKNLTIDVVENIEYSERVHDGTVEMRWVSLPRDHPLFLLDPSDEYRKGILNEVEWRSLGIKMSRGWYHCGNSPFEYNIFIFMRHKD